MRRAVSPWPWVLVVCSCSGNFTASFQHAVATDGDIPDARTFAATGGRSHVDAALPGHGGVIVDARRAARDAMPDTSTDAGADGALAAGGTAGRAGSGGTSGTGGTRPASGGRPATGGVGSGGRATGGALTGGIPSTGGVSSTGGSLGTGGTQCVPKSCDEQDVHCGTANDLCGMPLQCGTCPVDKTCSGGRCVCSAQFCPACTGIRCCKTDGTCGCTVLPGQCS